MPPRPVPSPSLLTDRPRRIIPNQGLWDVSTVLAPCRAGRTGRRQGTPVEPRAGPEPWVGPGLAGRPGIFDPPVVSERQRQHASPQAGCREVAPDRQLPDRESVPDPCAGHPRRDHRQHRRSCEHERFPHAVAGHLRDDGPRTEAHQEESDNVGQDPGRRVERRGKERRPFSVAIPMVKASGSSASSALSPAGIAGHGSPGRRETCSGTVAASSRMRRLSNVVLATTPARGAVQADAMHDTHRARSLYRRPDPTVRGSQSRALQTCRKPKACRRPRFRRVRSGRARPQDRYRLLHVGVAPAGLRSPWHRDRHAAAPRSRPSRDCRRSCSAPACHRPRSWRTRAPAARDPDGGSSWILPHAR